jgi:hypothetical protein
MSPMKGIVFTEFLEMVEEIHSFEMVDAIIAEAAPPSGGAYTAVGTYPAQEMGALVGALSHHSGLPAPELLRGFGAHIFSRFVVLYPDFFTGVSDTFCFLESIEEVIHTEVLKLYPDAELPSVLAERSAEDALQVTYHSPRCMADFAEGLIEGAAAHFGESLEIRRSLPRGTPSPLLVFTLTRAA